MTQPWTGRFQAKQASFQGRESQYRGWGTRAILKESLAWVRNSKSRASVETSHRPDSYFTGTLKIWHDLYQICERSLQAKKVTYVFKLFWLAILTLSYIKSSATNQAFIYIRIFDQHVVVVFKKLYKSSSRTQIKIRNSKYRWHLSSFSFTSEKKRAYWH